MSCDFWSHVISSTLLFASCEKWEDSLNFLKKNDIKSFCENSSTIHHCHSCLVKNIKWPKVFSLFLFYKFRKRIHHPFIMVTPFSREKYTERRRDIIAHVTRDISNDEWTWTVSPFIIKGCKMDDGKNYCAYVKPLKQKTTSPKEWTRSSWHA